VTKEIPFPDWVPSNVHAAAHGLSEEAALAELAAWIDLRSSATRPRATDRGGPVARRAQTRRKQRPRLGAKR
jgi:hypothetical protein